jgi:hypothetical protein
MNKHLLLAHHCYSNRRSLLFLFPSIFYLAYFPIANSGLNSYVVNNNLIIFFNKNNSSSNSEMLIIFLLMSTFGFKGRYAICRPINSRNLRAYS